MNIAFRSLNPVCDQRIIEVIVSRMEAYVPHTLSLRLKSHGSITLVLMLLKTERLLTRGTWAFKLLKIMLSIPLPGIEPNLFFDLPNPPSLTENVQIFLVLIFQKISGTWLKICLTISLLHLSHLSLILMAALLSLLYLKLNSSLRFSLQTTL